MYTGSIPPASIYGTWLENIEIISADDGLLVDLSGLIEITLQVIDLKSRAPELMAKLSDGTITIPSTGIIQWRVEQGAMSTMISKLYEVVLTLTDADGTIVVMVLGTVSILE
jgi:hypothetical protein